jgi:N-acetylglutamate synthase-like GNAT family acetyltransferase
MRIRKAKNEDFDEIIRLAQAYDLDYSGMESDAYWVATDGKKIVGIIGLKRHPDCSELCSLGVEEDFRGRGIGKRLVLALLEKAGEEIYLATIIPAFFHKFGFEKAPSVPASMVKKSDWCLGCRRELCTVMLRNWP